MSADRRAPAAIALSSPWDMEHARCNGTNWTPDEGRFYCRSCGTHFSRLRDRATGELVGRTR